MVVRTILSGTFQDSCNNFYTFILLQYDNRYKTLMEYISVHYAFIHRFIRIERCKSVYSVTGYT